jgi:hypothetical protein
MDSKPAHDVTPDTPPDDNVPPGARTPTERTLPHTPPFSPSQQRPKQRPQKTPDPIIERIENVIDRCSRGEIPKPDQRSEFELSPSQLDDLERGLQDEKPSLWCFWVHKLRYDYEASDSGGKLVLRMPSAVHEDFIGSLESTIEKELASLANQLSTKDETTAAEIRRIRKSGSTTLQYTEPELDGSDQEATREPVIVRHSPDASFKHPIAGSQAPGLVVEVSYSQQSKKLSRLAESYIINSEHRIRCVVAIDITYIPPEHKGSHKDKTATVSVWRASLEEHDGELVGICRQDVDAAPFRDRTGRPCEGVLQLTLADFLHPVLRKKVLPAAMRDGKETLSIPFATLAKLLNEAESDQELLAESDDYKVARYRKRKRTPSGELSDSREEHFAQLESADKTKGETLDTEWELPSKSKRRVVGERVDTTMIRRSARTKNLPNDEVT